VVIMRAQVELTTFLIHSLFSAIFLTSAHNSSQSKKNT
jgi:hypothetical protein